MLWWNISLIISENQFVRFPNFLLPVLWCSSSYTVINVLWKKLVEPLNESACRWPCICLNCVSGQRRLDKTWTFEIHTCLCRGAQILFTHKRRKLTMASLLLPYLGEHSFVVCRNEFLLCLVQVFGLTFSRIALSRKRWQSNFKSDLITSGLTLCFFVGMWLVSLTSYLCGLKCARFWSNLFFFWRHQVFQ